MTKVKDQLDLLDHLSLFHPENIWHLNTVTCIVFLTWNCIKYVTIPTYTKNKSMICANKRIFSRNTKAWRKQSCNLCLQLRQSCCWICITWNLSKETYILHRLRGLNSSFKLPKQWILSSLTKNQMKQYYQVCIMAWRSTTLHLKQSARLH